MALVTPVYNDIESFRRLCHEVDALVPGWGVSLTVIAVDDGSIVPVHIDDALSPLRNIERIDIVTLLCNLGHQRAIAVGLVEAARAGAFDLVMIADCDGEDRPEDMGRLIDAHGVDPAAIIVGRRSKRSEGPEFRLFYGLYKVAFKALTGRAIDFGNFCLIPAPALARLVHMPEMWNHVAASILRSRIQVTHLPCDRGTRYAGQSSMNMVSLMVHGLSAIAVFSDVVFARLFAGALAIAAFAIGIAGIATAIRAFSDVAIPGWATNVVGISMIVVIQAVILSVVASLTMLGARSTAVFVPAMHALQFRRARTTYVLQGDSWTATSAISAPN